MTALLSGLGLAFPAGLNAYIPLLVLALADRVGLVRLSSPYDALGSNVAVAILGVLLAIELVADKVPLVDHLNDVIQTVIRPSSGALLMLASTGTVRDMNPTLAVILGIMAAGSVHVAKMSFRPAVTVSTAGLGNPLVSTIEDVLALGASLTAVLFPALVLVLLLLVVGGLLVFGRRIRGLNRPRRKLDTDRLS